MDKKTDMLEFEEPKIVDYGDLSEITAGNKTGGSLDANFPVGTPGADLRFS